MNGWIDSSPAYWRLGIRGPVAARNQLSAVKQLGEKVLTGNENA
jgi:hypothetical protein